MRILRENTATRISVGPFLDVTDGITPEVALTVTGIHLTLMVDDAGVPTLALDADATASGGANDMVHVTNDDAGMYDLELAAANVNFTGRALLACIDTSEHLPVFHEFQIVSANVYDALFTDGDVLDVSVTELGGVAQSLTDLKDFADAGYDPSVNKVEGVKLVDTTTTNSDLVTAAAITDAVHNEPLEDHLTEGTAGFAQMLLVYQGEYGPGVYCDSGAANTNTVVGTDGTEKNPVSTLTAARTLADAVGVRAYYIAGNSTFTLAATHEDWEFFGLGSVMDNLLDLGSQDADRSTFINLTIQGVQGGAERIELDRCAIQDVSGAGVTTLHVIAKETGFVDEFEIDTSNDNEFVDCFSQVAGTTAPIIIATGAAGTAAFRRYSGGIELKSLSASHNLSIEGMGQVIFNADCNVNANVSIRGLFTITDNTAGMNSLTIEAVFNRAAINAEADTALSDYDGPTRTEATADKDAILALLPAALVGGRIDADIGGISGDANAAITLEALMDSVIGVGQINDASATTLAFATDGYTISTDDILKARLITFLTGAVAFEQANIAGYDAADGAQGAQEITVDAALTSAPANEVFFVIH